ncbi:MAG: hypothetical protein Q8O24_03515 [Gallionellaceae bacterium]|nr:hypothetical protein [Gallionellaceae bacterium]
MNLIRLFALVVVLIVLNGCSTQKDFVRPAKDSFTLGKSTRADVIRAVGDSSSVSSVVSPSGKEVEVVSYFYRENPSFYGMIINKHSLLYSFFENVLVGEEYNSAYSKDETKFDIDKITQIKKGMAESDVISLMGPPSGRTVFPIISDKDGHSLNYSYSYDRFIGFGITTHNDYRLVVTMDNNSVVSDVRYSKDGIAQVIQ